MTSLVIHSAAGASDATISAHPPEPRHLEDPALIGAELEARGIGFER